MTCAKPSRGAHQPHAAIDLTRLRAQRWLGRLIDSPTWQRSPLQQREQWLSIYLEKF